MRKSFQAVLKVGHPDNLEVVWLIPLLSAITTTYQPLASQHGPLFHRRTHTTYVYNGCLAWYNVVLTPRIRSSVKYSQLGQSANICDVSNQPTHTLYMYKKSQW